MYYLGGKSQLAKHIIPILLQGRTASQMFVEPFCGGCNITSQVSKIAGPEFVQAYDAHPQLIALWQEVSRGWLPPKELSWSEYEELRKHKRPDAITGYAGFAASFSGKWFAGYADGGYRRDYQAEQHAAALLQFPLLVGVQFLCQDYRDLQAAEGSIVYCDPPYAGTTGYTSKDKFDSGEFWKWAEGLHRSGCTVFVSESLAPSNWVEVWSKTRKTSVDTGKSKKLVEKLFTPHS